MNSAIPKRSSGDAAATPKAEPSLLSSLPPPPAPVPTQQKKVQEPSQSQQQRPQPSRTETISLPQVSSLSNIYQPRPKTTTLTDREKRMVKKLDELADLVSTNVTDDIESNNMLSVDPKDFMQRENRQGGSIDLFGSFITNSENRYDFFDTDPVTKTIHVTPLPNSRIPIFPEDFPPNTSEWPLRWWGIHQPSEELLQLHEEKALSLGYPVSHRKGGSSPSKIQPTADSKSSRSNEKDSKSSSRKGSESSRRRKRSGDSSGKERSRKRHSDDRRHRRS